MPDIFEQLVKELKMTVISELNKLAAIFTGVDINKCDLSDKEGLANLIYEWFKNYLGVSNSDNSDKFLVPGLTTPSLLSGEANNPKQMLTLKNTKELVKDLKNAKKTFEEIPGGEIDSIHRHQTLVNLNLLISNLENLLKVLEKGKKLCPLSSGSQKQYILKQDITPHLNSLIDLPNEIPDTLTNEEVKTNFYTKHIDEYKDYIEQVREIAVQGLKQLAEENLKKYYTSWGVSTQNFGKSKEDPPFSFEDAKKIFDKIIELNKKTNRLFCTKPSETIKLSNNVNLNLTKQSKSPMDPQKNSGDKPTDFDYDKWLNIYNRINEKDIKQNVNNNIDEIYSDTTPDTFQIKDIAESIKIMAENAKKHLKDDENLIENLYVLLGHIASPTKAKAKTKADLNEAIKLNKNILIKLTQKFNDIKKLKAKFINKSPIFKTKQADGDDEIAKTKDLLNYNLSYPKAIQDQNFKLKINDNDIELIKIEDDKINLKEFILNLLETNTKILEINDEQKNSNLQTINSAMSYCISLCKTWKTRVENLYKQLGKNNIAETTDPIITKANAYIVIHKKTIATNTKLKSIANKIKAFQLIPFGFRKQELIYLCNQLVEGVDLINEKTTATTFSGNQQQPTKEDILKRIKNNPKLKEYNEMQDYYNLNSIEIKKHPKLYANITKTLKQLTLNDYSWALAHLNEVNEIYKYFDVYRKNFRDHQGLYEKTYQPNSKFLEEILELTLILKDSKLKIKAQSLLNDLKTKFNNGGYSKTPEEYIELTQKIDKLRQKVNEKLYNNMRNYKDENKSNFTDTEMSQLMNEVDKSIKSDTDNLEQYQKFIKISNRLTI